ncbi:hypothetical protein R1flu_026285 [Riccia fluitans]|uniref:Uncharacterized protein n=1 Tax=Riccia fluitans TaxID=41844 RepID=A0ABD1XFJ7_9MARC
MRVKTGMRPVSAKQPAFRLRCDPARAQRLHWKSKQHEQSFYHHDGNRQVRCWSGMTWRNECPGTSEQYLNEAILEGGTVLFPGSLPLGCIRQPFHEINSARCLSSRGVEYRPRWSFPSSSSLTLEVLVHEDPISHLDPLSNDEGRFSRSRSPMQPLCVARGERLRSFHRDCADIELQRALARNARLSSHVGWRIAQEYKRAHLEHAATVVAVLRSVSNLCVNAGSSSFNFTLNLAKGCPTRMSFQFNLKTAACAAEAVSHDWTGDFVSAQTLHSFTSIC